MTAREVAVKVLKDVDNSGIKSDTAINNYFSSIPLDPIDKAFTMQVVYGTLREKLKIDHVIQQFYKHDFRKMDSDVKNILRIGVYQLFYLTRVPKWAAVNESVELAKRLKNQFLGNLVNGVLRNIANNPDSVSFQVKGGTFADQIALQHSHPKWLLERWTTRFGFTESQELMVANNQIPKITFRVNHLKIKSDELKRQLTEKQLPFQDASLADFVQPEKFFDLEEFLKDGLVSVQSESQGLACLLLNPKEGNHVLDVCAAPGGKSTFMAELMHNKGSILALDLYTNKLADISRLAETLGISIIKTQQQDARQFTSSEQFDCVLLDAPCTGTGVLSRRAELRWRLSPNDITIMSKLQLELLTNAAKLVKSGCALVYSTCSLEPEENIELIDTFISSNPEWEIQNAKEILPEELHHFVNEVGAIEILPHRHHIDGAFSIRLIKS